VWRSGLNTADPAALNSPARDLIHAATTLKGLIDNGAPWLEQAALAQFIKSGSLVNQIKRVRQTHLRRRNAIISSLRTHFNSSSVTGFEGGTHML